MPVLATYQLLMVAISLIHLSIIMRALFNSNINARSMVSLFIFILWLGLLIFYSIFPIA